MPVRAFLFVVPCLSNMTFDRFVIIAAICLGIAVAVWGLFELGSFLGVQWYVSAVVILLIGRFLIGQLAI